MWCCLSGICSIWRRLVIKCVNTLLPALLQKKLSCIIIAYRPIVWLTSKTTVTIVSGMSVTCHSHQLVVGNNIIESNFAHRVRPAFHLYSYSDACCSNYYRQSNGNYKFAQLVMHRIKLSVEIWSKGKPITAIKRLTRCWKGHASSMTKSRQIRKQQGKRNT